MAECHHVSVVILNVMLSAVAPYRVKPSLMSLFCLFRVPVTHKNNRQGDNILTSLQDTTLINHFEIRHWHLSES